jgi:hypothetical protein
VQVRAGVGLALWAAALAGGPAVRGDGMESPPPVLRATPDHPMRYWVARPPGWSASGRYPVLAAIPDATKQWEETLRDYARARDTQGARFVVVVPLVVTNGPADVSRIRPAYPYDDEVWDRVRREGRCAFDLEGLEAVFRDVSARDRGVAGVFMAGVEAAGHTIFTVAFRRPEWLRAAAVISGNWAGRCFTAEQTGPFSTADARASLPIRTFEVEGDPGVFLDQQARALLEAREHGFAAVSRAPERLPSRLAAPSAVESWFASLPATGPRGP